MSDSTQQEDFETIKSQTIDFDDFLVLLDIDKSVVPSGRCIDRDADAISKSSRVLELLGDYCKTAENDKQRLSLFCELVNHTSSELGTQNVIFCQNDPNVIQSSQKLGSSPNIIGVSSEDGRVVNGAWKNYHPGSNTLTWTWPDILISAKVKLTESTMPLPTDANTAGRNHASKNTPEMALGRKNRETMNEEGSEIDLSELQEQYYRSLDDTVAEPKENLMNGRLGNDSDATLIKEFQRQVLQYGVHQLAHVQDRKHCFALFVVDATLYLAYYDCVGIVFSTKLDLVANTYIFVLLIKVICGMTRQEAGFLDTKRPTIPKSAEMRNGFKRIPCLCSVLDDLERDAFQLRRAVSGGTLKNSHHPRTSHAKANNSDDDCDGNRLRICRARNIKPPIIDLRCSIGHSAIRRSFTKPRRTSESLANCPYLRRDEVYASKMTSPLEKRRSKRRKLDHTREESQASHTAREKHLDCLLGLYRHRNLAELLNLKHFAYTALAKTDRQIQEGSAVTHGLSALSYDYLLVRTARSLDAFQKAIRDIVLGHHLLFSNGFLHRNVCPDNLMIRIVADDSIEGVLNDWDLTTLDMSASSHVGTPFERRPFLATELLSEDAPPRHVERFDWESLFYAFHWICCPYSRGDLAYSFFQDWADSADPVPRSIKKSLLHSESSSDCSRFFKPLVELWTEPLRKLFSAGMTEREKKANETTYVMDDETLNGTITWEKVWDILRK